MRHPRTLVVVLSVLISSAPLAVAHDQNTLTFARMILMSTCAQSSNVGTTIDPTLPWANDDMDGDLLLDGEDPNPNDPEPATLGVQENIHGGSASDKLWYNYSEIVQGFAHQPNRHYYPVAWKRTGKAYYVVEVDANNANPIYHLVPRGDVSQSTALNAAGAAGVHYYFDLAAPNLADDGIFVTKKADSILGAASIIEIKDDGTIIDPAISIPGVKFMSLASHPHRSQHGFTLYAHVLNGGNFTDSYIAAFRAPFGVFNIDYEDTESTHKVVDMLMEGGNFGLGVALRPFVDSAGENFLWTSISLNGVHSRVLVSGDNDLSSKVSNPDTFYSNFGVDTGVEGIGNGEGVSASGFMGRSIVATLDNDDVSGDWDWFDFENSLTGSLDMQIHFQHGLGGSNPVIRAPGDQILPIYGVSGQEGYVIYSDRLNGGFANIRLASMITNMRPDPNVDIDPGVVVNGNYEVSLASGNTIRLLDGTEFNDPDGTGIFWSKPALPIIESNVFEGEEVAISREVFGPASGQFSDSSRNVGYLGYYIFINEQEMVNNSLLLEEITPKIYNESTETFVDLPVLSINEAEGYIYTEFNNFTSPGSGRQLSSEYEVVAIAPKGPVWTDFNWQSVFENGTRDLPFDSLHESLAKVDINGRVFIKSGESDETLTIDQPVKIFAPSGVVRIGVAN